MKKLEKKQQILKQTQTVPAWVLERKGTMVSYFQTDQIHRNFSVFDMMLRGKSSTCIWQIFVTAGRQACEYDRIWCILERMLDLMFIFN